MAGQPGRVVIVGAGPAGMALAFRGEGLHQSDIDAGAKAPGQLRCQSMTRRSGGRL